MARKDKKNNEQKQPPKPKPEPPPALPQQSTTPPGSGQQVGAQAGGGGTPPAPNKSLLRKTVGFLIAAGVLAAASEAFFTDAIPTGWKWAVEYVNRDAKEEKKRQETIEAVLSDIQNRRSLAMTSTAEEKTKKAWVILNGDNSSILPNESLADLLLELQKLKYEFSDVDFAHLLELARGGKESDLSEIFKVLSKLKPPPPPK